MHADTVAKLLHESARPDGPGRPWCLPARTTVMVDEAGMLSVPDLRQLTRLANGERWRLVLAGDYRQLHACVRRDAVVRRELTGMLQSKTLAEQEAFVRRRLAFGALITISLSGVTVGNAKSVSAYALGGCKWSSTTITIQNAGTTSNYNGVLNYYWDRGNEAIGSWNAPVSDFTWSMQVSSGQIKMWNRNNSNDGFVGLSWWTTCSGSSPSYFTGTPNSTWNEYYTYSSTTSYQRGTMVHEMGHSAGLGHVGNNCSGAKGGNSIMYPTGAGCGWFAPQADDINGIETLY